jgi:hypothetical protein
MGQRVEKAKRDREWMLGHVSFLIQHFVGPNGVISNRIPLAYSVDGIPPLIPKTRRSQRFSKRSVNASSIECGYVQTNSEGEKIMNTYTNTMHPKKESDRTARAHPFQNPAIVTIVLTLVAAIAVAAFIANRSAAAANNNPAVPYSNALELQYARPWLETQKKSVAQYGNALELQYARPWLERQNKPAASYSNTLELQYAQPWLESQNKSAVMYRNALEMQYAQPWLETQNRPVTMYGNTLEFQYAQPWLDKAEQSIVVTGNAQGQTPLNCSSNMEMLYACKNGFGQP